MSSEAIVGVPSAESELWLLLTGSRHELPSVVSALTYHSTVLAQLVAPKSASQLLLLEGASALAIQPLPSL
jgi:hypothetical protein